MFFKNLTLFRFPQSVRAQATELATYLADCRLQPVLPVALASYGFVGPYGIDHEDLCVYTGAGAAATWVTVGGEERVLPPGAINKAVHDRMKEASERIGLKIGSRQRKRFREEVIADMLPKAFVEPKRTDAYFDWDRGLLVVDTTSRKVAELVVSEIRHALGSFPALPLYVEVPPRSVLTGWIAGEPMPEGFALGDECELRDAADKGAVVKCQRKELQSESIESHLEAGMQCVRLALTFHDRLSFVIGEDFVVRKLKFLDGAVEALDDQEFDTARQELDARFALQVGEVGLLFDALAAVFKFSTPDDQAPTAVEPGDAPAPAKKRKRSKKALDGVESVTVSGAGMAPVTFSAEQFANLPRYVDRMVEIVRWVCDNEKTTISAMQRYLKCGYHDAALVIEALEHAGVLSPPNESGIRTIVYREGSP